MLRRGCMFVAASACFFIFLIVSPTQAQEPTPPEKPAQPSSTTTQPPDPQKPDAQQPEPQKPDASDEKRESSANPAAAAAQKTKEVTLQAAEVTRKFGQQSLTRARNYESGWLTGVYVAKDQHMTPLTGPERWDIYLRQTLITPGAYMKRMFAAGIDQTRGAPSQWDDGWGGYAERFASREGQFISANSLAALGNAALRYEPRYDVCTCAGFWARSRHAIARNFITYNQSEVEMRPQLALYGGAFGGGLISTAWKPHPRNAFAEGGRAMAGQAAYGALLNFFIEFSAEINRKIGQKK
jgi:hypothetical protein